MNKCIFWNATSVTANSERGKHVGISVSFENASGNNDLLHVSTVNDETRHNIPDKVSELSVPETRLDQQTHTHHMVTGQRAQTNQIPEYLTGQILTPRNPPSHEHQSLSTQLSQDNKLPMAEQTLRNQKSDSNNSINRLVDAIARIATQQRRQAATLLKPVSTNTLTFDGKNKKLEPFEDLFHTVLKMQPEMTEAIKVNHFHAHLRKEALIRNLTASNKKTLYDVLIVFRRKYANQNHKLQQNTNGTNSHSVPIQNHCLTS